MLKNIKNIYFLGIGGIGMSALAHWINLRNINTQGWDDAENTLVLNNLADKGIKIHNKFKKDHFLIDVTKFKTTNSIVIYTPAVSKNHPIFQYFKLKKISIYKRSELLQYISADYKVIAIAGTHGKTTISIMLSHILKSSGVDCNAFFGGISKNYNSNFLTGNSGIMVVEADEYDKSLLKLSPYMSLISSMDKDHGDIYLNDAEMTDAYKQFIENTQKSIIGRHDLSPEFDYTYSVESDSDFYVSKYKFEHNRLMFNLHFPNKKTVKTSLLYGAKYNMENAVAASALAFLIGVNPIDIGKSLMSFNGVGRRFEYHLNTDNQIIIDDYAHHPEELAALINSTRLLYPQKEIFLIFQPHLFSRTQDLEMEFASVLSLVDKLVLIDIYPAREEKISGVTSKNLLKKIKLNHKWYVDETVFCDKNKTLFSSILLSENPDLVITAGAGDVYKLIPKIKSILG